MSIYFYMNDSSRNVIKSDVTLLATECKIIYELRGMEEDSSLICTELCLTDSNFVSKLRLYKALYHLDVIVLCYDINRVEMVADYARAYLCDYAIVDMDMIRAAIYNEKQGVETRPVLQDYHERCSTPLEKEMLKALEQEQEINRNLSEKLVELQTQRNILQDKSARESSILRKMMEYYRKLMSKSIELEGSLQQYKAILSEDIYDKVNAFKYKERPQVIYFKEYQYTLGMYELLNVLYNALYYQKHKSVKVLQLLDSSGSMRIKEVPEYYKIFMNAFNRSDMYQNDFICCVGGYKQLLTTLLENTARTDVLIVFDTLAHDDIVLQNAMLQYGVCRTGKVAKSFALGGNTIVNEDAGSFIEYKPLNLEDNTFVHNASSDVILRILSDVEEFSSTI